MHKKYYLFRNATVERFFASFNVDYSGYNDISSIPENVDIYVWFYLSPIKTNVDVYITEMEAYIRQLQFVLSRIKPHKACYAFTVYNMHDIYHIQNRNIPVFIKKYIPAETLSEYKIRGSDFYVADANALYIKMIELAKQNKTIYNA